MSDLEARIAEVLAGHIERKTLDDYCEGCSCGWNAGLADAHEEHAAAMLAPAITSLNAAAWHAGRESVALDMMKTMGEDMQRPTTTNPYRSNDE